MSHVQSVPVDSKAGQSPPVPHQLKSLLIKKKKKNWMRSVKMYARFNIHKRHLNLK